MTLLPGWVIEWMSADSPGWPESPRWYVHDRARTEKEAEKQTRHAEKRYGNHGYVFRFQKLKVTS